jgi:hypothetical protein
MNLSIEREGLTIKVEASEEFAQHALTLLANIVSIAAHMSEVYAAECEKNRQWVTEREAAERSPAERDTMPPPAHIPPEPPIAVSPEVPPAVTVLQQAAPVPVSVQPPQTDVPPAQAAGFVFPIPR